MSPESTSEIVAARATREVPLDAASMALDWAAAAPVTFCSDWRGENADPERETRVRALWTPASLFLRFECRYREIFVFPDNDANGWRDHLWERDVAEAFLQPDPSRERYYREFEVSPHGQWIDLDVFPGGIADLKSGMQRSVCLDSEGRTWTAELAIPMRALTGTFDPSAVWRVNFYRVEGTREPRFYSAWRATGTVEPNFHVPSAFGWMRFGEGQQNL